MISGLSDQYLHGGGLCSTPKKDKDHNPKMGQVKQNVSVIKNDRLVYNNKHQMSLS